MHRVELVEENHSHPLQRANDANVAIVDVKREAVSWNQIVECVEKVRLIVVIFTFRQVVVSVVERKTEELKVLQLTCIKSTKPAEARIVGDAAVDLTVENSSRNDSRLAHHH